MHDGHACVSLPTMLVSACMLPTHVLRSPSPRVTLMHFATATHAMLSCDQATTRRGATCLAARVGYQLWYPTATPVKRPQADMGHERVGSETKGLHCTIRVSRFILSDVSSCMRHAVSSHRRLFATGSAGPANDESCAVISQMYPRPKEPSSSGKYGNAG